MSSSSDESSSSYEESDSSDAKSDKVWTCDDIYPAKINKASVCDDSSSSSDDSIKKPAQTTSAVKKIAPVAYSSSSESNEESSEEDESEEESDSDDEPPNRAAAQRPQVQRHSSGEIEVHLKAQARVLSNVKNEEEERRKILQSNKEKFEKTKSQINEKDASIQRDVEEIKLTYDSSDESIESLKKIVAREHAERNIRNEENGVRSEEKAKFEKRNMEREMRLAKARERIEKKKDDEAAKKAKESLKDKDFTSKLDMSKAARIERAYSWYSRMAMPTREKMKERVEYMPASSGVTPDDVDLLPWNARGTFVSVAAMMRMNRTASNFTKKRTGTVAESETDSD